MQLWAVRRTSATRASLLLGTEPLWAVPIGVSVGGDTLGPAAAAGVVLVIAGTFRCQRIETRFRTAISRRAESGDFRRSVV